MNQSEFLTITCNLLKTREKSIAFGFTFPWLKNWQEIIEPITTLIAIAITIAWLRSTIRWKLFYEGIFVYKINPH